ncbi:hypothetical protein BV22DRAFT_904893 [Leucogyrophana mollusca]|uniref:Uncharacterized protein n=1 Tax=Leucogyrophana mollusca TaxID=85980 RepID=A0ACB8AYH4_9AGAM|nr:hypothetical protein BV22DRAFT_904893 [Leucogyrophana mollusca]
MDASIQVRSTFCAINEALWLPHVYVVVYVAVQEGACHVVLATVPAERSCNVENNAKGIEAHCWREGIAIVDTGELGESLCDQAHFVSQDVAMWSVLDGVCPTVPNGLASFRPATIRLR